MTPNESSVVNKSIRLLGVISTELRRGEMDKTADGLDEIAGELRGLTSFNMVAYANGLGRNLMQLQTTGQLDAVARDDLSKPDPFEEAL